MDHFKGSWGIVKQNLSGWVIFGAVLSVLVGVTGGLGTLLMPNAMRATRDALRENRAPELGDLFKFENLSDDLIGMIVYLAAAAVGSMVVIGSLITIPLVFWVPMLAAEGRFVGIEAAKASFAHAKANFVPVLTFVIVSVAINWVATMACFVPLLITFPLTLVASWRFYEEKAAEIQAAALAEGATMKA